MFSHVKARLACVAISDFTPCSQIKAGVALAGRSALKSCVNRRARLPSEHLWGETLRD